MSQVNQFSPYTSSYRSEIDGLRAFAVLSVVAFHAFPSWLKGGFIGVDVFFVISGFLITSHIFEKLDKGQFSFTDFFGRRIRRIFPALILVMASSLAFGWFALLADEFAQLGKHVASGAAFFTNFILVDESGYFDNAAETKPMLHLWSLAVEEQFYIVWPLVLWLAWKRKFNLLTITILVAAVSFYLNLRFVKSHPIETFFWPVGRFWELLSGSVLAWLLLYKSDLLDRFKLWVDKYLARIIHSKDVEADGTTTSNLMSFFGLLLLAYGVIRINESLSFPSKWALIPVLGAVLIIASGSKAWLNRIFLMNPIAVWFGLISYPLYLWHWPILSFLQIIEGEMPHRDARIIAVTLSIFLAWFTYRFIEKPIRFGSTMKNINPIIVLTLFAFGLIGLIVHKNYGMSQKVSGYISFTEQYLSFDEQFHKCENKHILESSAVWEGNVRCWQSKNGLPNLILLGDSHAEHLFYGFAKLLPNLNVASYINGGRPSLSDASFTVIFEELLSADGKGKKVILTSFFLEDWKNGSLSSELAETIEALKASGYEVAIVGDVVAFPFKPSECEIIKVRKIYFRDPIGRCEVSTDYRLKQKNLYNGGLKLLSEIHNIPYAVADDALCDTHKCSMFDENGSLLYIDTNHLNMKASVKVVTKLVEKLSTKGFF
ncbi:acyltransferase [Vibrio cholerae]|uniref:acyltransferase family protein n=1 Tax=Vibrio cholerae TaxID=666 RepID=UPI0018F09085|nr:acyltransferase family protein [Vibrio cholerae]MBJ6933348.1 acyltransferase [Vibrio cholerae]